MTHEPIRPEPDPRGAEIIPIGLGYRPAATPGAPGLPKVGDQDDDQVLTGEVVEPVDRPDVAADTGTWIDQRRAYLDDAPDIIPSYLRDAEEFTQAARWVAAYYAHVAAFHATRSPVYLLRLVARSPRGAARLLVRWARWVSDAEARPLIREAAGRELNVNLGDGVVKHSGGDAQRYMLLTTRHDQRVRGRATVTAVVAVPVSVLLVAATLALPAWAIGAGITGVLALLGLAGRQDDRPIVTRFTSPQFQRPLDSTEVVEALAAIGIKGKPTFAHPIHADGPGWTAEVDLPRGATAADVMDKRAKLAGAMRRPITTVWPSVGPEHPARLVLWVAKRDPAKEPRRLWPLMKSGQADIFQPIPLGWNPRGALVETTLMYSNLIVGGIPGSGKTSAALVLALAAALDPTCEVWAYELKGSGDLESIRPICHRYVSGDDDDDIEATVKGLRAANAEQKRRKKFIQGLPVSEVPDGRRTSRELAERYPEQNLGPMVVIIDEAQELFGHEEYGKEAEALCARLIKKARAYGIILILLTQDPDAKSLPPSVSRNAGTRLCLAVMDWRANNNVLGTGAYDRGLRATDISADEVGTGILARQRDHWIVRCAFIKQTEAELIGKRALALRIAAGTLSGEAAGEEVVEADASTVVDHLRAVWPDGADRVHSHRLVDALAAYRPDLYGAWLDEADAAARSALLSAALRPHRVRTVQLTIRDCCGGAKGVRWDDLVRAAEDADGDGG